VYERENIPAFVFPLLSKSRLVISHRVVHVPDHRSVPATIAVMAKAAREAAGTYAMRDWATRLQSSAGRARQASMQFPFREWAARLATKADHRDYVGQLKALYDGILERWRYVQEPGEWVHGEARSLIACVLGTKYNGVEDARNVSLASIPSKQKGWGDCDDISTVVAAAVMALGMKAFFRVVMRGHGGHVSVVAVTPNGQQVSIDPVGHPTHPFGWKLPAEPNQVSYFDMNGAAAENLGACNCQHGGTHRMDWRGRRRGMVPTQFARVPMVRNAQGQWVRGPTPTVLSVPAGYSAMNGFEDGLTGVDEYGREWMQDSDTGTWVQPGMSGWADVRRRWRKRFKAIKKVAKKVVKVAKKVVKLSRAIQAKILGSKIAQRVIGAALQVWGIPFPATGAVMKAASTILKNGGLIGLLRLLRKSPKAAFQLVAKAVKQGLLSSNLVPPAARKYLSGADDGIYAVPIDGYFYEVAPIGAVVELYGVPDYRVAAKTPDTSAELNNVKVVLQVKPNEVGNNKRKSGQGDADWFTDAAYFATYPKAPKNAGSNKTYKAAWIRINSAVKSGMANAGLTTAPTIVPTKKGAVIFAVNPNEAAIARDVVEIGPTSAKHQGKTYNRAKQPNETWLTDVSYWQAYPNGPHKISKSKAHQGYAQAWMRIQGFVKSALAAAGTPVKKPSAKPSTKPTTQTLPQIIPQTGPTITPAANTVPTYPPVQSNSGSQCWEDVDQSICVDFTRSPNESLFAREVVSELPRTETTRAGVMQQSSTQTLAEWLANVAYWRAYPTGPVKIPGQTAPEFAAAWKRIYSTVSSLLSAKSVDPQPPVINPNLPDIEPDPEPPVIDPVLPDVKEKTNWVPIAVAAAAALLLLKGAG